jgi:hypothetical protein
MTRHTISSAKSNRLTRALRNLLPMCSRKFATKPSPARPRLEALEDRQVPTITYHGGALLPHVEVQALYLGSDWAASPAYLSQANFLEGFLNNIVHSSYMDMLTNAGYGVGRGSFNPGTIALANINKNFFLTDGMIRNELQRDIFYGSLISPDANRLYVVFVEDNVAVMNPEGENSIRDFLGYHTAFAGYDAFGRFADIRYAIIPYHGGWMGNAQVEGLSTVDSMTEAASHEITEAMTDPDVNYKRLGWYDDQLNGENGDIVNQQYVYLNGYAVQKEPDLYDQPMTPAGATANERTSFILTPAGDLYEHTARGWSWLMSGVDSVSDQSIDNTGHAMVDVVTRTGAAWEFHAGSGWHSLGSGVAEAKAGDGVSYVLLTNGKLWEFHNAGASWQYLGSGVSSIDAGTDQFGVNKVDVVNVLGAAWECSDTSGWHFLANNVWQVSAGRNGVAELLLFNGDAYHFSETTGSFTFLGSGVAQITAGTDQNGNFMIDLVTFGGGAYEYCIGSGWSYLGSGVWQVSKARAGVTDVLFSNGYAYEHDANDWLFLTSGAWAVA